MEQRLDLHGAAERQGGDADRAARMPPPVTENLDHEIGRAVHDDRQIGEGGIRH